VLRIFSPLKIRRLRPGLNPRTWVLKASTLPLDHCIHWFKYFFTKSLFRTGQLSSLEMYAINFYLSLSSLAQSNRRWSTVWSPLAQEHSGDCMEYKTTKGLIAQRYFIVGSEILSTTNQRGKYFGRERTTVLIHSELPILLYTSVKWLSIFSHMLV